MPFPVPIRNVQRAFPSWDPTPWIRALRALYVGDLKYIWASDGRHELYDLSEDPGERSNLLTGRKLEDLAEDSPERRIVQELRARLDGIRSPGPFNEVEPDEETLEALRALGYAE